MKALVTGGGGFLGRHIARRLQDRGDTVLILGRGHYPDLETAFQNVRADIRDREAVFRAVQGCEAVFHTAARPGIWGDYQAYYSTNVEGTRNVLDACRHHSVKKLIYTSSPSVVFGADDLENGNESLPYPSSYACFYPQTKAEAERMVLEASEPGGICTVSLRPHLIWGPGDPHLIPRLLDRADKRRLIRVGEGDNRVDLTYIDNAAEAHILASDALEPGSPVCGRCYFISDGKPVVLWDWIHELLRRLGRTPVTRSLSYPAARRVGAILEAVYGILRIEQEPPMTRFLAGQLAKSHYFDISRARADFGYAPVVDPADGLERLIRWLQARPAG